MTWYQKAWSWIKGAWSWLRWIVAIIVAVLAWRWVKARVSALVGWVSNPVSWQRIPGHPNHVTVNNPNTGKPETVELPQGVTSDQVVSVGISQSSGGVEVETLHNATDRTGRNGDGNLGL